MSYEILPLKFEYRCSPFFEIIGSLPRCRRSHTHCHLPEEIQGYHVNGKLLGDRQRDNIAKVTNILLRYYITTIIKKLKIKRPSKHGSSSRQTTGEAKTLLPDNGCMYTKHGKSVYIFANQSLGMFVFISRR